MATRAAVLIESSNIQGQQDLPGARVDVDNWRKHLLSRPGGLWYDGEVRVLNKPSWARLQSIIQGFAATDYVFITFSGHGYHKVGVDLDETCVCLNEHEDVPVYKLNPGNPRCSVVVDSCRGIVTEEDLGRKAILAFNMRMAEADEALRYRMLFDAAVQQCEEGIIRQYACDIGQSAGESSRSGGYFSSSLVNCAQEWHDAQSTGQRRYYPANQAFQCAEARTTKRAPQQRPQYEGGRRLRHFPLAVRP